MIKAPNKAVTNTLASHKPFNNIKLLMGIDTSLINVLRFAL
ncbi:hypothetical protein CZ794_00280 [Psychrobacter sp. JB385]|nr:hypothetical protein CZ794_00280 [Psychrobacter sp. JB385]